MALTKSCICIIKNARAKRPSERKREIIRAYHYVKSGLRRSDPKCIEVSRRFKSRTERQKQTRQITSNRGGAERRRERGTLFDIEVSGKTIIYQAEKTSEMERRREARIKSEEPRRRIHNMYEIETTNPSEKKEKYIKLEFERGGGRG